VKSGEVLRWSSQHTRVLVIVLRNISWCYSNPGTTSRKKGL
jgi:hypothetical protein